MDIEIVGSSQTSMFAQQNFDNQPSQNQNQKLSNIKGYKISIDDPLIDDKSLENQQEIDYNIPEPNISISNNTNSTNRNSQEIEEESNQEIQRVINHFTQVKGPSNNAKVGNQTEVIDSDEDDDDKFVNEKYFQGMMLMTILIVVFLIFKFIVMYCPCFIFISDQGIKDAVYVLFREVFIGLIGILILECVNYYDGFSFLKINVLGTSYCALMTLFTYTILGFFFAIMAQKQIDEWKQYEVLANDYESLEKLKTNYESEYYLQQRRQNSSSEIDQYLIQKIRYLIMRLEFIHPIYLPPVSETFLRKDFNFAQYLSYCYGKTLISFYNTNWITLVLVIICANLYKLMDLNDDDVWKTSINFMIPCIYLGIFLFYFLQFKNIQKVLYPQIEENGILIKPEEINFQNNYNIIDPFNLYTDIPEPDYLLVSGSDELMYQFENSSGRRQEQDEEEYGHNGSQEIENEPQEQSSSCCGLCKSDENSPYSEYPNRHEKLFICGRSGKKFAKLSLQFFFISSVIYFACYVAINSQNAYQQYREQKSHGLYITLTIVTIICPILMLIIWIVFIPSILTKLTVITNIEMMKDRDLIEKVISQQKMERARISYRIYQVLKLIWRELAQEMQKQFEKDRRLRNFTKKQIIEAFQICGGTKTKSIKADSINSLIRQCGQNLTKQESYLLMKKAYSQGDRIQYKEFSTAVENLMNEVKIDAYLLVYKLLKAFFNHNQRVPYDQIETFFGEFSTYFIQEDVAKFLVEVQYIKRDKEEIDISELASLIRDDVEHFAK